ncbi:ferredoxin [Amycolatopsis jejuensis]|uniref:ferredoxin n=1 Tax=Amycolatopsis jejuensis TaxID=330084 RepID=UPI0005245B09|nr:ferredoxin [Amycolatopsis jejuensis]
MYEIRVDEEKCCAYGNCVVAAPDVFALHAEADKVVVLQAEFPSVPPHVYRAIRSCPAYALTVVTEERPVS